MPASRREFVFGMGAIGAFTLFSSDLFSIDRTEPELILYNGNFWTVNPRQPRAQAVAISGGRFLAIGSNDEVLALALQPVSSDAPRARVEPKAPKPTRPVAARP